MFRIAAFLLIASGMINSIPSAYVFLTELAGGTPIIQIITGVAAVLVGFGILGQDEGHIKSGI